VELPALVVLGFWMFTQVINGLTQLNRDISGGVAWWAHIGGFLFGLVIMPMLAAGTPEPDEDWKRETDEQFDFTRPQSDRRDQPPGSMW